MVRITDQYFSSNPTVEEVGRIARCTDADPIRPFGEACRSELASMRHLP